jgi:hypothetical protein
VRGALHRPQVLRRFPALSAAAFTRCSRRGPHPFRDAPTAVRGPGAASRPSDIVIDDPSHGPAPREATPSLHELGALDMTVPVSPPGPTPPLLKSADVTAGLQALISAAASSDVMRKNADELRTALCAYVDALRAVGTDIVPIILAVREPIRRVAPTLQEQAVRWVIRHYYAGVEQDLPPDA